MEGLRVLRFDCGLGSVRFLEESVDMADRVLMYQQPAEHVKRWMGWRDIIR